jgi:hypothetical protein
MDVFVVPAISFRLLYGPGSERGSSIVSIRNIRNGLDSTLFAGIIGEQFRFLEPRTAPNSIESLVNPKDHPMTLIGNRAFARTDLWSVCSVIVIMISASGRLFAQQPTQAQINAIREACRVDYQEHCAGVPAGAPALACLQKNVASVSEACQRAVNAADVAPTATQPAPAASTPAATVSTPKVPASEAPASTGAPAATPPAAKEPATTKPSKTQISRIRQACRADYRAHCAGVTAGALGLAFKNSVASLSAPCRLALGDAALGSTQQAPPRADG